MTTATGTRERLIESALHRFAGDGVLGTTLEDVRGDAGASVGAVYHHFPDKQALLDAARERALATFQTDFAAELERHAGAEQGIKAMVRFLIRWCFRNPDAANSAARGPTAQRRGAQLRLLRPRAAVVDANAHYGVVRDLDFLLVYAIWLGPALEVTRHALGGNVRRPDLAAIEALAEAAWTGLAEER